MRLDQKVLTDAIKKAKELSVNKLDGKPDKVRKFDESVDIIIQVRDIDLNNPNNRIEQELLLPHPIEGNNSKVCFIVKDDMEIALKNKGFPVINDEKLLEMQNQSNKEKKRFVKQFDYFVVRGDLMVNVARVLARFLGQQGKMPKPQPKGYGIIRPNEDIEDYIAKLPRIIRIKMKKQLQIQLKVGKKSQDEKIIAENIDSIMGFLDTKLPFGVNSNVTKVFIKTTMGKAVKVEEAH